MSKKSIDITDEEFHFGDWLKAEMKERGWDIYDMAVESGVSDKSIAKYRRNARAPKVQNLQLICRAFGKKLIIKDE